MTPKEQKAYDKCKLANDKKAKETSRRKPEPPHTAYTALLLSSAQAEKIASARRAKREKRLAKTKEMAAAINKAVKADNEVPSETSKWVQGLRTSTAEERKAALDHLDKEAIKKAGKAYYASLLKEKADREAAAKAKATGTSPVDIATKAHGASPDEVSAWIHGGPCPKGFEPVAVKLPAKVEHEAGWPIKAPPEVVESIKRASAKAKADLAKAENEEEEFKSMRQRLKEGEDTARFERYAGEVKDADAAVLAWKGGTGPRPTLRQFSLSNVGRHTPDRLGPMTGFDTASAEGDRSVSQVIEPNAAAVAGDLFRSGLAFAIHGNAVHQAKKMLMRLLGVEFKRPADVIAWKVPAEHIASVMVMAASNEMLAETRLFRLEMKGK
jgi:hypothetical protein